MFVVYINNLIIINETNYLAMKKAFLVLLLGRLCASQDDWLKTNLELAAQGIKQPLHGGHLFRCPSGFGCTKPDQFDAPTANSNDPAWDEVQLFIRQQAAYTYSAIKTANWKSSGNRDYDKYTITLYREYPFPSGFVYTTWFTSYPDSSTFWSRYNPEYYPISLEHDLQYPFVSTLRSVQTAWRFTINGVYYGANNIKGEQYSFFFDVQVGYIAWAKSGAVCSNGFYAERMLLSISFSLYSLAVEYPTCLPCQVGTWNTCRNYANCTYPVQHVGESYLLWRKRVKIIFESDINLPATNQELSLIGSCLPCRESIFSNTHFGMTTSGYGLMFDRTSDAIPFRCLGGYFPPLPCGNNALAALDSLGRAVKCACGLGTYDKAIGVTSVTTSLTQAQPDVQCVPCVPGYACSGSTPRLCSVGEYSAAGASACTQCTRDPCPNGLLRPICQSGSVQDEIVCVSCRACANFGRKNGKLCYGAVNVDLNITR